MSVNKLADRTRNEEGARQVWRLSLAVIAIMLIGVIMAGIDQVVKAEFSGQQDEMLKLLYVALVLRLSGAEVVKYEKYLFAL